MWDVRVASVSVEILNGQATGQLLAAIPQSEQIRRHLSQTLTFHHWDEASQRAFWVTGNGKSLRCVTVTGLTVLEMAEIVASPTYQSARAAFDLPPQLISAIIESEIDVAVGLVN